MQNYKSALDKKNHRINESSIMIFDYIRENRYIISCTTALGVLIALIYTILLPQSINISFDVKIGNIVNIAYENDQEKFTETSGNYIFYRMKKGIAAGEYKLEYCKIESDNDFESNVEKNMKILTINNKENVFRISILNTNPENFNKCIDQLTAILLNIHKKNIEEINQILKIYFDNYNLILKNTQINFGKVPIELLSLINFNSIKKINIFQNIITQNNNSNVETIKPILYEKNKTYILYIKNLLLGFFIGFFSGISMSFLFNLNSNNSKNIY